MSILSKSKVTIALEHRNQMENTSRKCKEPRSNQGGSAIAFTEEPRRNQVEIEINDKATFSLRQQHLNEEFFADL